MQGTRPGRPQALVIASVVASAALACSLAWSAAPASAQSSDPSSSAQSSSAQSSSAQSSSAQSSSAQSSSARDAAAARALFEEGVTCADGRDWACAADRFDRAYALRASPVIAYNLGHALVELGRLVEGAEMLRRAMRDESASAQVRADARRIVDTLAPRIARLTLHVRGPIEGVTVRIGPIELPEALHGTAAPIDPGAHTIEALRGGEVVASAAIEVEAGGTVEAELTIPEAPPEAAAEAATAADVARGASEAAAARAVSGAAAPAASDDGPWIGLGIGAGVVVIGAAVLLGVLLAPPQDAAPYGGNLGIVEVGP